MALPALTPSSITSHNIGRIYNIALHEQSTVTQTLQHNTVLHEQSTVTQTLQHNTALHEQSTVTQTLQHNTHFLQTKPIIKATVTRPVQLQYKPKSNPASNVPEIAGPRNAPSPIIASAMRR